MSFSSTGYQVDSHNTIMTRIYDAFVNVLPDLEFTPDNIIIHWQEILAYEQRLTQIMLGDAINNFSALSATGVFLEKLGIENGVIRKEALQSNGYLTVTAKSNENHSIASGAMFTTNIGLNYYATETISYPKSIEVVRSDVAEDDIPSPYKNITIDGLYTDAALETGITTDWYTYAGDVVTWNIDGIVSGVVEGNSYYADVSGSMGTLVSVVSESAGADYNVSVNKIVVANSMSFVDSVTNEDPFYNASDIESDKTYRQRILKARRKTFSLGRIDTLAENIAGVRNTRSYQVTNTDKNSIPDNWDLNILTGLTGNVFAPTGEWFGFSFSPSDDVATIKEFKLYGRVTGTTISRTYPRLEVYLKPHYSGAFLPDTGYYLQKNGFEHYSLERDNYTGWQEMTIPMKYNGVDNSRTYQIYMRETGFVHLNSGHWEFAYSGLTSSTYLSGTYLSGVLQETKQLLSRTMYGAPAYNIDVVVEDGHRFDPEIKDKIDKLLNYESYGGNSPVCIQYDIRRAVKTYLSLSVYIYLEDEHDLATVTSDIKSNLGVYLKTVKTGSNIYYTKIEHIILGTDGVLKLKDMRIKLNGGEWVTRTTQDDLSLSDREYVDLDLLTVYDGIIVYEG